MVQAVNGRDHLFSKCRTIYINDFPVTTLAGKFIIEVIRKFNFAFIYISH